MYPDEPTESAPSESQPPVVPGESEARLRQIIDLVPDFIFAKDDEGRFLLVNRAVAEAFGMTTKEVEGRLESELNPSGDEVNHFHEDDMQVIRSGQSKVIPEETLVDRHGQRRYLQTTKIPFTLAGHDRPAVLGVAVDISDHKRIEEELRQHRDHLEELVSQRAAELRRTNEQLTKEVEVRQRAEQQLARRAAELERSNRDLQQFAYVASHDLQEPLRAVSGYCQLLLQRYQDDLDETANEFLGFAVDGAARMKQLIDGLLRYSRVETQGAQFVSVDCGAAVERSWKNLGAAVAESAAVISYDGLPTVSGDVTQLGQLFQNLIGNAIKYRGDAAPVVDISARTDAEYWIFSVRDNGIGFEEQFAERIFTIFHRLHSRQKYSGSGMGLAICARIVERHGGRIWAESTPGKGSEFYFTIPRDT